MPIAANVSEPITIPRDWLRAGVLPPHFPKCILLIASSRLFSDVKAWNAHCSRSPMSHEAVTMELRHWLGAGALPPPFPKRFGPPILPLTDTDGIVNYELRRKFPKYPLVGYHRPWQGCISPAQNILLKLRPCNLFWPAKRAFWKGWRRKCLGTPIAGWV